MPNSLDTHAGCHTPVLTDELTCLVDSKTLWMDYGINIIVSAR